MPTFDVVYKHALRILRNYQREIFAQATQPAYERMLRLELETIPPLRRKRADR